MSTYLALAQAVKRESGLTGGGPTSFATASGDDLRLFHWVSWAWRDLDLMHEQWKWRRGTGTATTGGGITLTGVTSFGLADFGRWLPSSRVYQPSAYKVSAGASAEQGLTFLEYDNFRSKFIMGSHTAAGLQYWTAAPNGDMLVGPTPDENHVVRADYIKKHVALESAIDPDAAEPTMPADFHPLITWYALREYGGFDAASEVWQRADRNYRSLLPSLNQSQLPAMRWGARPLA